MCVCVCVDRYISISHLLYPLIHKWILRSFPCPGYYIQCCSEHGIDISS